MPLEQTADGLQIQPVAEIISEMQTAFRDPVTGFGAGVKVQPNTGFGQFIGVMAEREALLQQNLQVTQSNFDPNEAPGIELDVLAELTATFRRDEDQSASGSGLLVGTPGTAIGDGSRIQNVETSDIWTVQGGLPNYVIPAGGSIACTILAQDTGPVTFLAATTWTIVDTTPGWNDFATTADIDPEDIGHDDEVDEDLRERREDELFAGGNDLSAIKAQVTKVVDEVAVYENRDCGNTSPDGIPPGAFEVVVEGGVDSEIAQAILDRKPPGAEAFGQDVNLTLSDQEGNPINIGFTRVSDVDVWVDVTLIRGNAEVPYPENTLETVEQVVLDFGNANAAIGQNVIPDSFVGDIFEAMKDPETGNYPMEQVEVLVGLSASTGSAVIPIDIRSRADYDSLRINVSIPI